MIGLTKSAALEYASRGIRINAVRSVAIETPLVAGMIAKEPETMKDIMNIGFDARGGRTSANLACFPGRKDLQVANFNGLLDYGNYEISRT